MTTTGWVLVWVALIIATLAFLAFIAWHLFKKAQRLLIQASQSAEVFSAFAQAVEAAETTEYRHIHAISGDAAQKEEWRTVRRLNLIKRRQRKNARRQATLARWQELTIPSEQGLN